MTGVKEILCRLCRKNITDKGFQVIDSVTRDMLDVLLLKLKFSDESKEVICNACKRKLKTALEFKSTCLNTDNAIIPHVDCEENKQFDLGEIYVKENGSGQLMGISGVRKICRLCMQLIKGEIRAIGEEELEAIHKFAPEMYISIIKDPVLCEQCFDSLSTHNTFLKNCSEVEQSMPDTFESSATESRTAVSPSDKNEDVEKGSEIKEEDVSIKSECVDIKSENEEEESDTLPHSNNERFENRSCTDTEEELKYTWKHKNRSIEKYAENSSRQGVKENHKRHCCLYCKKKIFQIVRHWIKVHKEENEVQTISKLHAANPLRRKKIDDLRRKGDYEFNKSCSSSDLIVSRKSKKQEAIFVPCPSCLGYFSKSNLRHHVQKCCPEKGSRQLRGNSRKLTSHS